jgi:putative ABC transport system permease protein
MIGVIMGVSTFIFAPTLAVSIQQSSALTTVDLAGSAALEVRGESAGFSAGLLSQIKNAAGVELAAPLSNGGGLMLGQSELLIFFGIDPAIDQKIRTYQLAQGHFLSSTDEVMLGESYATEKRIKLGDSVTLLSIGGARTLKVVGTLSSANGIARLNHGDMVVMNLDDALALRGNKQIDAISILPTSGTDVSTLKTQLQKIVPAKVVVDAPAGRNQGDMTFNAFLDVMIGVISFMILGIGSLLIYNTITVSVAQRRSEIGVLRALGTSRSQIRNIFLLEAGILGFVASLLGVALGYVLVRVGGNLPVLPKFVSTNSTIQSTASLSVPLWLPPVAVIFGTVIPIIAAYFPSRAATMIDPVEAMVQIRAESGVLPIRWWRVVLALVLVVVLLILRFMPMSSIQMAVMVSNAGVFLSFAVMILILPPYMIALSGKLPGWMQRLFGMTGMIAAGNVTRRPKRTMSTAMLIMLGVGMGVLLSQSYFGYSDFQNDWNRSENIGELTVMGASRDPLNPELSVPANIVDSIKARTDIAATIAERDTSFKQGTAAFAVRAIDMTAFRAQDGRFLWDRGDELAAYQRLQDATHPALLVGASITAITNNYQLGHQVTLDTPSGPVAFDIVGTFLGGVSTDRVMIIMDRGLYSRLWQDDTVNRLTLKLKPGIDPQTVRRELLRDYAMSAVITLDNADMRAAFAQQITSIATVTQVLATLFALIIVSGFGSTLLVAVIDRRREIGMLRAVGMLRRQITQGIVLEAVLIVALTSVVAVPGAALMTLMQQIPMQQIMGIRFSLVGSEVVACLLFAVVVAVIAAYIPARQAGRTDVLEAMRYE